MKRTKPKVHRFEAEKHRLIPASTPKTEGRFVTSKHTLRKKKVAKKIYITFEKCMGTRPGERESGEIGSEKKGPPLSEANFSLEAPKKKKSGGEVLIKEKGSAASIKKKK